MSVGIVIIGAGAAGLSAAVKLTKHGFKNITILEASDRIGGRIYTKEFGNAIVDLGAQWCHGEEGNIVYEMVKDMDLLSGSEMYWDNQILISNGTAVPKIIAKKLEEIYYKIADKDDKMKTSDLSLGEFMINKYYNILNEKEYQDISKTLAEQFLDWCHKFENSIDASDNWFESSAKGYLEYHECSGHPILNWKGAGYMRFIDVLLNKYPDEKRKLNLDIRLRKEVICIEWQKPATMKPVVIKCKDNSVFEADYVIVTLPLGVLKHSPDLFKPSLPEYKINCIENLGFGVVDKIFLRFEKKWWLPDWNGIRLLWTNKDKNEILKKNENENWIIDVFGFYTVDQCPDLLCGWVTGSSAKVMESLSDQIVLTLCSDLLKKFVANHKINDNTNYSDPIDILRSKWGENPYSRGSYSLRLLKTESMGGSALDLSKPIVDQSARSPILFAGEATSDHFYSTVHGAVESGFREADRIIKLNKSSLRYDCKSSSKKVVVVGAGISGLTAAHTLLKTKLSYLFNSNSTKSEVKCLVKIMEAKNRPGGRINSICFGREFVEAGAQWLHGSKNVLYNISDHYKLLSTKTSLEGQGIYLNEDGVIIDKSIVNIVDFVVGKILENLEEFALSEGCDYPECVKDYLDKEFEKYLSTCKNDSLEIILMKRRLYEWHVRFQIIDNSCISLKNLSAKAWGKYSFEGENAQAHINYIQCYNTVINKLCEELPSGTIDYSKEVSSINWSSNGVVITTSDNNEFFAESVIITVSLGVLKKNYKKWFKPELPKNVCQTIDDMGFATINKVFLQFTEAWWDDIEGFQFVWFENSSKCDSSKPSSWVYDMSGFDVLQPGATNTLVGWVGAQGAILVEQRSEEEVTEDCLKILRKILNKDIPNPCRVYRSTWHNDPHVLGSYSHTTPACDKNNTGWMHLSAPIFDELGNIRILFAGEACSEQFFSTTHGAMKTGINQAEVLLDSLNRFECNSNFF